VTDETARLEIHDLEKQRCAALIAGDIAALDALMADDLVHIHGNGHIDDKAAYLKGVETKFIFHRIERGDLNVRVYGAVAVVIGTLSQSVSVRGIDKKNEIKALTTQTWIHGSAGWKQNTCHNAFLLLS
jgi:ketosteroid isomerase-like protein